MAYALNNVATTDEYTDDTTLRAPNVSRITINVSNASVYVQFACRRAGVSTAAGAEQWESEQFLTPGLWIYDDVDTGGNPLIGLRARSGAVGVPARVSMFG